jgi:hydroxypyruvate reductase
MHPLLSSFRQDACCLFETGIQAANPAQAVTRYLADYPDRLVIGKQDTFFYNNRPFLHIIAVGKAACAMAEACQKTISPDKIKSALVITSHENFRPVENCQVIAANHPLPDETGLKAGLRVLKGLQLLQKDSAVLLLLSGGASSLLPCPAEGLSLQDKVITTRLLMDSGASIAQLNCVRKHLSALKGGRMAEQLAPHRSHSLILSDVPDNDLSVIASGPTYADETTFSDAISILHQQNIWDKVPCSIRQHLCKGQQKKITETPKADNRCFRYVNHTLVGDNQTSLEAIKQQAEKMAYRVIDYQHPLSGESRIEAEKLVIWLMNNHAEFGTGKIALITGGETTVKVTGNGRGGRNQEMALSFALAAEYHGLSGQWLFLSGGTDGIDGPTDAAGGMVDPGTLKRIDNAREKLENNDSYSALAQSKDLLLTGATRTNVADIQILLYQAI